MFADFQSDGRIADWNIMASGSATEAAQLISTIGWSQRRSQECELGEAPLPSPLPSSPISTGVQGYITRKKNLKLKVLCR